VVRPRVRRAAHSYSITGPYTDPASKTIHAFSLTLTVTGHPASKTIHAFSLNLTVIGHIV
jgi:hypothetical protein